MRNKPNIIIIALVIILVEVGGLSLWINLKQSQVKADYGKKADVRQYNYEKEKKKIKDEFEKNKYLASGKDAYERIYNRKGQSVTTLLEALSREAFPEGWKCEVKVEEFINFILLVQVGSNEDEAEYDKIIKYLFPVISYGSPYLKNVAVFDKKHKCYLFFDEEALSEIKDKQVLADTIWESIKDKGNAFSRYNSIRIDFEKKYEHIFVPAIVSGKSGFIECVMMLDTGASMTVVSLELAQKTGNEDLNNVQRKTFSTAKGLLSCPIVTRKVSVGSVDTERPIAVNTQDDTNLLGVDFFENKDYIIDSTANCIYVWNK